MSMSELRSDPRALGSTLRHLAGIPSSAGLARPAVHQQTFVTTWCLLVWQKYVEHISIILSICFTSKKRRIRPSIMDGL